MSPEGRERIDWKLITDLPVRSRKDALRMLNWYALRWKIGVSSSPTTALTDIEIQLLDRLIQNTTTQPQSKHSLSTYMVKVARLGGYLARSGDPPPGPTVMWRGL